MKSLLRKILLGNVEVTEYSTVTIKEGIEENVFLKVGKSTINISYTHWLLCLEPVTFGVWIKHNEVSIFPGNEAKCKMFFTASTGGISRGSTKNIVANITVKYFEKIEDNNGILYLLKLCRSTIHHVNVLKASLLFYKYYKKPKFTFEKYKSLIAAYSYPRRVRIISFEDGTYFNIFPMDLLGEVPYSGKYVFGLRHTNAALKKIITSGKIVVSEVPFTYKEVIYKLGKHHGSSPPSLESLPFETKCSESFQFPVPDWADSYKEIKILKTISLGSHMLIWGEIKNEKELKESTGNLYHIHFFQYYHQKLKQIEYPLV